MIRKGKLYVHLLAESLSMLMLYQNMLQSRQSQSELF